MEKDMNNSGEHNAVNFNIDKFHYKIIFKFFHFRVAKTDFCGLPI